MNLDTLLLCIVMILFPILVNVLHKLYLKNYDKEENDLFFDITLISCLYLFTGLDLNNAGLLVTMNTVFLLALVKKRKFSSFIIFLFIFINYTEKGILNSYITMFQYSLIYVLYFILIKLKKEPMFIKVFMFIKIFFIFLYHIDANVEEPLINGVIVSIIFIFVNVLVQYSIKISEDIVKLNVNLKTIEEDERIRTSLFKITHEIKNPIAVCKSYLDMFDFNNPDHERYIPILKDEMKKILILLQDFSSMNKIKIINEILDINLLLDDVKRQLETFVISDNIRFITELNDEEFYLEGDYNRISQVLTNIIKNAKEAKDESKEAYIILKTKIKNDVFKIIVEDNGIGISEEDMKRIKEPFFTTKKNGTGLGIPLSCEIIKAHGGKIEFQSEEGEGTKVIISLPVKNFEF